VREVRGVGTLVPLKILVVATNVEGRVTNRYVLPGTPLEVGTPMFELANPKIEQDLFEAESGLKGAEADLVNLARDARRPTAGATIRHGAGALRL